MPPIPRLHTSPRSYVVLSLCLLAASAGFALQPRPSAAAATPATGDGQAIFRFDTFGDEQLWTDRLRMHEVIQSAVSPALP